MKDYFLLAQSQAKQAKFLKNHILVSQLDSIPSNSNNQKGIDHDKVV
jgi:hypothetical protein